ncbi:MAG: glutamine amidotransferase [Vicinamibacteria bacterium]
MFESVFEFLFKYRPVVFENGTLTLAASWPSYLLALLVVVVAVPTVLRYRTVRGKTARRDRVVLTGLRAALLAVILFCLCQPALVLSTVVPLKSFVGILLDDSLSLQIADRNDVPRAQFVNETFGPEGSALLTALSEKFMIRFFGFSKDVRRIDNASQLGFNGVQTHLGSALEGAADELAAVPLAGLVLVTDGADNSHAVLSDTLLALKARSLRVYTVGLGLDRFSRDIELSRVEAPRSVLKGSSLVVDLSITQRGFAGTRVRLDVEDSGRIVNSREIDLSAEGEVSTVKVDFTASDAGPRLFRFRVQPQSGEMVTQNNEQEALIIVEDRREKVLYFEGEPRFELKFIRRGVAEDENLQVVVLQRTAENKFLRLDVSDGEELAAGFPRTREELFRYRAIVLGSVEASFFTYDQLRMMADFVSQRGGGLLMLGGRQSFSAGGYAGTPLEEILPVTLQEVDEEEGEPFFAEIDVEPTPVGKTHPITQFAGGVEQSITRWGQLPPLTTLNPIFQTKPGATTLLVGTGQGISDSQVVLAFQRYGRGKTLAFTVHDSWQWQMHADIPLEDMTHETLWRKLLRWLVSYVPDPVSVTTERGRYAPFEPVTLTVDVDDDTFIRVNNAEVIANIKSPSGELQELGMEWTVDTDGQYRASFLPEEKGLYEIHVEAQRAGVSLGEGTSYVLATDLADEYFGAEMNRSLLERIAEDTGGRFYTADNVGQLAEDMSYVEGGTSVREERDLWDMPALFLLLLTLAATEWGYRKARGLA